MKKPEVALENFEQVYDYYLDYQQPQWGARFGHWAMSKMFHPTVEYIGNAEDLIDESINAQDERTVIIMNHLTDQDQYVISSMITDEEVFRPMIGKTFIQAKEPLFHHPNRPLRPLLRRGVDIMGAVPAFRKKDVNDDINPGLRRDATARLIDMSIEKLRRGGHMAMFPEGTRNKDCPETVQEFKSGLSSIIGGVAMTHQVNIVPIGFTYQLSGQSLGRRPHIAVGEPKPYSSFDENSFLEDARGGLQAVVDSALSAGAVNLLSNKNEAKKNNPKTKKSA